MQNNKASPHAGLAAVIATTAVAILLVWGVRSLRLIAATLITLAIGLVLAAKVLRRILMRPEDYYDR